MSMLRVNIWKILSVNEFFDVYLALFFKQKKNENKRNRI